MSLEGAIFIICARVNQVLQKPFLIRVKLSEYRETSNEDGVALAWSVAERLLSTGAITFFATHYPQICQLSRVYPSVKNQHLESTLPRKDNGSIMYTYKIRNGPCLVSSNYGIHVAASTGFPDDVVDQVSCFIPYLDDHSI